MSHKHQKQALMQSTTAEVTENDIDASTSHAKPKERLELYNSLFGQGKDNLCEKTGLQLSPSLNYSLYTFLHLSDLYWVLAMIDVDRSVDIIEKYGHDGANRKIIQIGVVIKKFCDNDSRKLKGFNCDDKQYLFALLMYCHPKLITSEKYIAKLIKKIKLLTNETVCVGIAKMKDWETFEEWKQRGLKNLKKTQNQTQLQGKQFYSDIGEIFVNPKNSTNENKNGDEKTGEQEMAKLGTEKEFHAKMKEIANNENYDWVSAVMDIDDLELFMFSNDNNKGTLGLEIEKIAQEMENLFNIYGNMSNIENGKKYYGYKLNDSGQFGMILHNSKDRNKCFVPAHIIIETLKDEIGIKCPFTVSIGCCGLIEDDLGMCDDWFERIQANLKYAKRNGKNHVCFGIITSDDHEHETKVMEDDDDVDDDDEVAEIEYKTDDAIQTKSLEAIEVCFRGYLHHT